MTYLASIFAPSAWLKYLTDLDRADSQAAHSESLRTQADKDRDFRQGLYTAAEALAKQGFKVELNVTNSNWIEFTCEPGELPVKKGWFR